MERDLSQAEFQRYRDWIYQIAGISYPREKLELLSNRIRKRLRATKATSFDDYLTRIRHPQAGTELQAFLDCITTNETYFYRCQRHWEFLRDYVKERQADPARRNLPLRIWSAAASTGAEAFTILLVLREALGPNFGGVKVEVLGTDLSAHVLEDARTGIFRSQSMAEVPADQRQKYFKSVGNDEFQFDRTLAALVQFRRHNLMEPLAGVEPFELVFLRNVMIYFDQPSRERVLNHVLRVTRPGGYLLVGEAESLVSANHGYQYIKPSIFWKPNGAPVRARS